MRDLEGASPEVRARHGLWRAFGIAVRHPLRFPAALVRRVQDDGMLTVAAAMAYYFFFSLFPFLLFLLALASVLPLRGLDDWVLRYAAQIIPGEAYQMLERTVRGLLAVPRSGLLSLGAGLALWTASSAMEAVIDGINRAYRVPDLRPWWRARSQAIGVTIALSALLILAFVASIFGGMLAELAGNRFGPPAEIAVILLRWTVVVVGATLLVAAINYVAPSTPKRWEWLTPGSVLFTLGFAVFSAAFSYYVDGFSSYDATYGSLGAVIVLLLWMYALAVFLLLGAELNALLEQAGREGRVPERDATPPRRPDEGVRPGERITA
jgi:membrane protein